PACEVDATGEDCRAADSAFDRTPNRIRRRPGTERPSTQGRDCALRAFCTRRGAAVEGCPAYPCHAARPNDRLARRAHAASERRVTQPEPNPERRRRSQHIAVESVAV